MDWDIIAIPVIIITMILLVVGGVMAYGWYATGVQVEMLEKQGIHITQKEAFWCPNTTWHLIKNKMGVQTNIGLKIKEGE